MRNGQCPSETIQGIHLGFQSNTNWSAWPTKKARRKRIQRIRWQVKRWGKGRLVSITPDLGQCDTDRDNFRRSLLNRDRLRTPLHSWFLGGLLTRYQSTDPVLNLY